MLKKMGNWKSLKIFSRWRHILFPKSQFNDSNPNPKPEPKPNPDPKPKPNSIHNSNPDHNPKLNPNGMFAIRQSFKHPF